MARTPIFLEGMGEYGATKTDVTIDGSAYRVAFGRSGGNAGPETYYLAVMLTKEAATSLKEQLEELLR